MKISKVIEKLEAIKKFYGDLDCIYSKDDEGNGFSEVYYEPSAGYFDGEDFETGVDTKGIGVNAVCIN